VKFDIKAGVDTKDYEEVAQVEHLQPLEVSLKQMVDEVVEMRRNLNDMLKREDQLRSNDASLGRRIFWTGVCVCALLAVLGIVHIAYLRSFFKEKKLID
jgi:hypothetical protein